MSQITYLTNFVNPTGLLLKGLLLTDLMNEEKIDSKKRKKAGLNKAKGVVTGPAPNPINKTTACI